VPRQRAGPQHTSGTHPNPSTTTNTCSSPCASCAHPATLGPCSSTHGTRTHGHTSASRPRAYARASANTGSSASASGPCRATTSQQTHSSPSASASTSHTCGHPSTNRPCGDTSASGACCHPAAADPNFSATAGCAGSGAHPTGALCCATIQRWSCSSRYARQREQQLRHQETGQQPCACQVAQAAIIPKASQQQRWQQQQATGRSDEPSGGAGAVPTRQPASKQQPQARWQPQTEQQQPQATGQQP
jgi:hypothetical protein